MKEKIAAMYLGRQKMDRSEPKHNKAFTITKTYLHLPRPFLWQILNQWLLAHVVPQLTMDP